MLACQLFRPVRPVTRGPGHDDCICTLRAVALSFGSKRVVGQTCDERLWISRRPIRFLPADKCEQTESIRHSVSRTDLAAAAPLALQYCVPTLKAYGLTD